MERWVNDYKLAERIYQGYRPVLPFEAKDVGNNTTAIKMEISDAYYKSQYEDKQIKNDIISPFGGKDLTNFVKTEFLIKMSNKTTFWFFKIFIKKFFNKQYSPDF